MKKNKEHLKEIKRLRKKLAIFLTWIIVFLITITTIFLSIWNFLIKKENAIKEVVRDKKIIMELFPKRPDISLIDPIIDIFIEKLERNKNAKSNFILTKQNIFVLHNWEIVAYNIVSKGLNIDSETEENNVKNYLKERINLDNISSFNWNFFIKSSFRVWKFEIFVVKSLWYSWWNILSNIALFIVIIMIISAILYIVSIKIASKVLKPVEKNLMDMNDFIDNAWHELKTPLAVINSDLLLLKEIQNYDESFIENSLKETKKMHNLLDCLMTLSWVSVKEEVEKIDLYSETWEILRTFNWEINRKNINIKFSKIWKNIIKSNLFYIEIIISNIVWNAIKYSRDNSDIIIKIEDNSIEVQDFWEWIKKENMEKIFKRFFREDESRNSNWFGIGLSLVKRICEVYNYKIKVESEKWKWTIFKVFFKK